jgi:proline dehydrogenase
MQKQTIQFDDTKTAFAIRSNKELGKSHFVFNTMKHPLMVKAGIVLTKIVLALRLPFKGIIKSTLFNQFCGGESIDGCIKTVRKLGEFNVHTILDYSVEGASIETIFDHTRDEILHICASAKGDPHVPFCVVKLTGLGDAEIMTKAQAGEKLSEQETVSLQKMKARAEAIAQAAKDNDLMFMIDAEESWIQDVIDQVAYDLIAKFNTERPIVYNTYQLYRHEALSNLKTAFEKATSEGHYFGAKLVRGAYMEKERDRAEEYEYPSPIHKDKASTDRDYDGALTFCMEHIDKMGVCAGTHNEKSSQLFVDLINEKGIDKTDRRVYAAQLLGMSDHISFNLAKEGFNVAKYVPYGPIEKVMPYLFRRAEENTSISGQTGRELTLIKKEIQRRKTA